MSFAMKLSLHPNDIREPPSAFGERLDGLSRQHAYVVISNRAPFYLFVNNVVRICQIDFGFVIMSSSTDRTRRSGRYGQSFADFILCIQRGPAITNNQL